jgi:hypothetical protein
VRFGLVSVTLSNAWGAKKCVGDYCTFLMVARMDFGLWVYKDGLHENSATKVELLNFLTSF